ncbi:MAG: cupin domain-containing protein [Actinomycetota bacterium]|nr:cupin domain-containing protein [Actinomycetota bacterium]
MAASDPVHVISAQNRVEGEPTPGMVREQAVAVPGMWGGLARTEAGMTSGWHHHGDYDTCIYIASGSLRMESGPDGAVVHDAVAGDFVFVPRGSIHREGNPGDGESQLIVVRAGQGPVVVNVDGPADY